MQVERPASRLLLPWVEPGTAPQCTITSHVSGGGPCSFATSFWHTTTLPRHKPTSHAITVACRAFHVGLAWIELSLLLLLWGGSCFSIAIALRELGPITSFLLRVVWVAVLLWIIIAIRGYAIPRDWKIRGEFLVTGV